MAHPQRRRGQVHEPRARRVTSCTSWPGTASTSPPRSRCPTCSSWPPATASRCSSRRAPPGSYALDADAELEPASRARRCPARREHDVVESPPSSSPGRSPRSWSTGDGRRDGPARRRCPRGIRRSCRSPAAAGRVLHGRAGRARVPRRSGSTATRSSPTPAPYQVQPRHRRGVDGRQRRRRQAARARPRRSTSTSTRSRSRRSTARRSTAPLWRDTFILTGNDGRLVHVRDELRRLHRSVRRPLPHRSATRTSG